MKSLKKNIIIIFIFISNIIISQEKGEYLGTYYSPKKYNGHSQIWCITEDKRGVMYFGTTESIIEYDGVKWRKIFSSNASIIRDIDIDTSGRIFVSCYKDFGYLAPNSNGKMEYISLINLIEDKNLIFHDVWDVSIKKEKVFFSSRQAIFSYNTKTNKLITHKLKNSNKFYYSYCIYDKNIDIFGKIKNNKAFVIKEDSIIYLNGIEKFKKYIFKIIFLGKKNILITKKKLFELKIDIENKKAEIIPFVTEIDSIFEKAWLYRGSIIDDSLIFLNSSNKGAFLITKNGKLIKHFSNENYLKKNPVRDNYNTKYEVLSPFTIWNEDNNFNFSVNRIIKDSNIIYVGSGKDLLLLDINNKNQNFFEKININSNVWSIKKTPEKNKLDALIAGTSEGIFLIEKNKKTKLNFFKKKAFVLLFSKFNPERLYIGSVNYLYSIIIKNKEDIKIEKKLKLNGKIRYLTESKNGDLWMGTSFSGLIKIDFNKKNKDKKFFDRNIFKNDFKINYYNNDSIKFLKGKQYFFITNIDNKIIVPIKKGFIEYSEEKNEFIKYNEYPKFLDSIEVEKIYKDKKNIYWLLTKKNGIISFRKEKNNFIIDSSIFKRLKDFSFYDINPYDEDFAFFVGSSGIVKFDKKKYQNIHKRNFKTLIRKIKIKDSIIFEGTNFITDEKGNNKVSLSNKIKLKAINYKYNTLLFEFAAAFFVEEEKTKYSYKLENFDEKWANCSEKKIKEYTNLYEGKYIFKVRAKNIFGKKSEIAFVEFEILPPWYRSFFAYFSYIILSFIFIFILIKLYTKQLKEQNIKLEKIVSERTKEILEQNKEITLKNEMITSSITYAQTIQKAILPMEEEMKKYFDYFIFFRPKDIVSGDFYWVTKLEINNKFFVFLAVVDCTGHGVPGAFMSMIGSRLMSEIVKERKIIQPSEILELLDKGIKKSLKQEKTENDDGMDLCLCRFEKREKEILISFSGAKRPLFIYRKKDNIIETLKADRRSIGGKIKKRRIVNFTNQEFIIKKEDVIYFTTDGYIDQNNSERKRFGTKQFLEFTKNISEKSLYEQKKFLKIELEKWMKNTKQRDDITVVGIKNIFKEE